MSNESCGEQDSGCNSLLLVVGSVAGSNGHTGRTAQELPWDTRYVRSLREARPFIYQDLTRVVLCEHELPDGNWRDMLDVAASRRFPPPIIVTSRQADDYLWAEVLNLGGYDVLTTPLDPREALRAISLAWDHWETDYESARSAEWERIVKEDFYVRQLG